MSNLLPVLAAEIRRAHADAQEAAKSATEHAIRCGKMLAEAKAALGHGAWLPWLAANAADISERTAQGYMRLARTVEADPEKRNVVADLTLRDALVAVSTTTARINSLPEESRQKALSLIDEGKRPTDVFRLIKRDDVLKQIGQVPPALVPNAEGRKKRFAVDREKRQAHLAIGPNEAGMRVTELRRAVEPEFPTDEIESLKAEADALERKAKQLREEYWRRFHQRKRDIGAALRERHGPVFVYTETFTWFNLTDEQLDLAERSSAETISALLGSPGSRGWHGDINQNGFSSNGPGL